MRFLTQVVVGVALTALCHAAVAGSTDALVLGPTELGPLRLMPGATVSESTLKRLFPKLLVTYDIGEGDSPAFHHFQVADAAGTLLFTIKSFIKDEAPHIRTSSAVPIQLLQVFSPTIPDSYGLRVGDTVGDILSKRGADLPFGWGHFDLQLGSGQIFYIVAAKRDPTSVPFAIEEAVKGRWRISSISWPEAAWE
jgi:hypothetical protein